MAGKIGTIYNHVLKCHFLFRRSDRKWSWTRVLWSGETLKYDSRHGKKTKTKTNNNNNKKHEKPFNCIKIKRSKVQYELLTIWCDKGKSFLNRSFSILEDLYICKSICPGHCEVSLCWGGSEVVWDKLTPLLGWTGLISARCYCIFMTTFPQTQKVKQECWEYVSLILLSTHTHARTSHWLLLCLANQIFYLLNLPQTLLNVYQDITLHVLKLFSSRGPL